MRLQGRFKIIKAAYASKEQGAIGSLDVVAQEAELLDQGNKGMEDFQVTALSESAPEVGKGGAARMRLTASSNVTPFNLRSIAFAIFSLYLPKL